MEVSASNERIVNTLEKLISTSKGKISPQDAAASTGFTIDEVNEGLNRLLELYESRVTMNKDSGSLLFLFAYPFRRRGRKTLKEVMVSVLDVLWKGFTLFYKAAIGIILIVYTIVFVLLIIAVLIGGGRRDDDDNPAGRIIAGIFRAIFEGFLLASWLRGPIIYGYDDYGHRYKRFAPEQNKGKKFIKSVFHFVLGPERTKYDPLGDAKEAAEFIRKNNGKLTAGHIVALSGVNYEEAESRLAEYISRFKGEAYISHEGTVVAEFPQLVDKRVAGLEGGKIIYYIDEVEEPYEITGNSTGKNVAIAAMNLFNLLMSLYIINFFNSQYQYQSTFLEVVLGYFPLVFSILFFVIPILRAPVIKIREKRRMKNVIKKQVVAAFISRPDQSLTIDDIIGKARLTQEQKDLAEELMQKLVLEYEGRIDIAPNGNAVFTFPRLSKELLI